MLNRRHFTCGLAAGTLPWLTPRRAEGVHQRKKIAFLGTTVFEHSHAQHFLDRLVQGYAWDGRWRQPRVEVAGVYIDQFPDRDIGRRRIEKYGLKLFPSVEEALTLGGQQLAVDGVVLIGEHGQYPRNAKGQTLYPRYAWFKRIVNVFEDSGRSVPVFNDKHLSTEWDQCAEMVADARRLEFAFLAGSSLPVTWRLPGFEVPWQADLRESVCVAYGGVDSYDFHALETAQCMSERRRGGETGLRTVRAVRDAEAYAELEKRPETRALFTAALTRSHSLPVDTGYPTAPVTFDWAQSALPSIVAYFIEHADGFRTSIFLTGIRDFNYAGRLADGRLVGCQMMLPMPGRNATTADFFNPLTHHIENTILTGHAPYPVERTLLTSGMVIGGVDSLAAAGQTVDVRHMAVRYQPPRESMYWNALLRRRS